MDRMALSENLQHVEQNITAACHRSGRHPHDVRIVAVTKYVSMETTQAVLDLGITDIGESREQEARHKIKALGHRGTWHFIGHLQSNKVKHVLGKYTYIHSVDRVSLAKEMNRRAAAQNLTVNGLVQVNVAGEQNKFGLPPDEVIDFVQEVSQFPHLRIAGLMTMAPHVEDPEEVRPVFRKLRELRDEVQREAPFTDLDLSMGMSNDYEVAIEEGATIVRVGSALVGRELR